jgi:DNA-binding LacI/PurR family transcriptional regulator
MFSGQYITSRAIGFCRYYKKHDITPLIVLTCSDSSVNNIHLLDGYDSGRLIFAETDDTAVQLSKAMDVESGLTAVFGRNDSIARQVIDAADEMKIAVPGRLSVAGYTNVDEMNGGKSWLTSVQTPVADAVTLVLNDYFNSLDGTVQRSEDCCLKVKLVEGKTTGPASEF